MGAPLILKCKIHAMTYFCHRGRQIPHIYTFKKIFLYQSKFNQWVVNTVQWSVCMCVCVRVCVSAPCFLRISWAPVQKPWRAPRSCWKWPIKHSARLRRMASLRYTPTQNMADFQPWILTDNKNWSWGEMSEWSVYVTFIWNEKRENSFLFLFFLVFLILFLKWFYKFKYWLFLTKPRNQIFMISNMEFSRKEFCLVFSDFANVADLVTHNPC